MGRWRSILWVLVFALGTVIAADLALQRLVPAPEPLLEVDDGVLALRQSGPEILVIGSSHARSFAPIRDRSAAASGGRSGMVLVALDHPPQQELGFVALAAAVAPLGARPGSRHPPAAWSPAGRARLRPHRRGSVGWGLGSWALTQSFFVLTLIPFRAPSIGVAATFAGGLFGGGAQGVAFDSKVALLSVAVCAAVLVGTHVLRVGPLAALGARAVTLPAPLRGVA